MKTYQKIKTTPDSHIIESIRNTKITGPEAVGELVDNALDAGASKITIETTGDLVVSDNGKGCSNIEAMLRMGRHYKSNTTSLGRYGVGLKNASIGLCDEMFIETNTKEKSVSASISWIEAVEGGEWPDVMALADDNQTGETGTAIRFSKMRRRIIKDSIRSDLAFTFGPAIWEGAQISINNRNVEPWFPKFGKELLKFSGAHPSGLSYSAESSITDKSDKGPFVIVYSHRVICETSEPCGAYSPGSRFICVVKLYDGPEKNGEREKWQLLKHKDGLSDSDAANWLYDSLLENCRGQLEQLHEQGEAIELDEIAAELASVLGDIIGVARRPGKLGTTRIKQSDRPRKVNEAESVSKSCDDDVRQHLSASRRGFGLQYDNLPDETIGRVDVNKKRMTVRLNACHPYIKSMRTSGNMDCIRSSAVFLICQHQTANVGNGQCLMTFEAESGTAQFLEAASTLLRKLSESPSTINAIAE